MLNTLIIYIWCPRLKNILFTRTHTHTHTQSDTMKPGAKNEIKINNSAAH